MNRLKIYCCAECGTISLSYGNTSMHCCGNDLVAVPLRETDVKPTLSESDGDCLLDYHNPMSKDFYIAAVIVERYDRVELIRLFPEQAAQVRLSQPQGAKVYTLYRQQDEVWIERLKW